MNIRRPLNMVPDSLLAAFARIDLAPLWHCVRLGMFFCFPIFEKTLSNFVCGATLVSSKPTDRSIAGRVGSGLLHPCR